MQHAGQAEPEQADRIFSGQKSAQAVTQGQTGLSGCFPADISVKELPGFQPLLPAVIPEAIDVGSQVGFCRMCAPYFRLS